MSDIRRAPSKLLVAAALFVVLLPAASLAAETDAEAELKAEVPALFAFHEVIFKIWHDAWPQKDIELLTKLAPDVRRGVDAVSKAELPGILRDKQLMWREGVGDLQRVAAEYDAAIAMKNDAKLLAAAEKLHSQFEKLHRIIRPPLKELDDFHVALYRLYHYELPAGDLPAIKVSAAELKEKMGPLSKAALPESLSPRKEKFEQARVFLDEAVTAFAAQAQVTKKISPTLKQSIESVHAQYQKVAAVFD